MTTADLPADPPAPDLELDPLVRIRAALARHRALGDPAELERGLAAAQALIAGRPELARGGQPDVDALRGLADSVGELGELLGAAAQEADRAVAAACAQLWTTLGLTHPAPRWTATERDAARMVFACACAAAPARGSWWLPESLRRIAAGRLSSLVVADLAAREPVWLRALGGRYGSVRHRCAPRTALRSRGLSDLIAGDPASRDAVRARLERWFVSGAAADRLAAELEAAVVHVRTPSKLA